ncbi:unnamed protein product [Parnassius mnemosyne]|uniref:DDE Tnp4 domain-containing protein n=1 Tax=Parnassius mnemosyne TaxID=213953 RepID=A0AAV1LHK0_9NEOP
MAPCFSKQQKIGLALTFLCLSEDEKKRKKRKWMKLWLKERITLNHLNILRILDSEDFRNFLRMDQDTFNELLEMVRPMVTKKNTVMRQAVSAEERLIATLRFLATGRSYKDLRFSTVTSFQLLSKIIPETCWAIYKALKKTIKLPSSKYEWDMAAKSFQEQWQFHNCVGCMDGKHIIIEKPSGTGSLFYNYKGTFSVVLFAIVNANYEFIYVHTGSNGSMSDGGILKSTRFYEKLINDDLKLSESFILPGTNLTVPYVFLGDSAFALETNIMKPFPDKNISKEKRIFNYRLCRARRVVENAFGILASRFRVFRQPISVKIENLDAIVLASCALHNFLRQKSKIYWTPSSVDYEDLQHQIFRTGDWRQQGALTPLHRTGERNTYEG